MRIHFDDQLEQLNKDMIDMGSLIEKAIGMAVEALIQQDVEKSRKAMEFDDEVDRKYRDIEGLCLRLLLHQQPVATDLRTISAALKMITDMERIGDHATDISELAIALSEKESIEQFTHIEQMAKETMLMLIHGVEAYVEQDYDKAVQVINNDDVIDDLFCKVRDEIINVIQSKPEVASQAADLLMAAKYFERIGDHATNIAEWVIFSITGNKE
ncbi:MAG: phosphate signaling complex protein PhoU [Eubacteriales bacterium]|nr:phosphate signaling complex protein PhoU [Eubacteriales bacterium]